MYAVMANTPFLAECWYCAKD